MSHYTLPTILATNSIPSKSASALAWLPMSESPVIHGLSSTSGTSNPMVLANDMAQANCKE